MEIKRAMAISFVEHGGEVEFSPENNGLAFNAALVEVLSSEGFRALDCIERLKFLAQNRPLRNTRRARDNYPEALASWRREVHRAVQEYGHLDLTPHTLLRTYWAEEIAAREPKAEIEAEAGPYRVRLYREEPQDRWFPALISEERLVKGNCVFLRTGHISSRSLTVRGVYHRAVDGEVVTIIVEESPGRERPDSPLPAAMEFYRRDGDWWGATLWRVGVNIGEACLGPGPASECRQGDAIFTPARPLRFPKNTIPYEGWWELENHKVFWGKDVLPPLISERGDVGFLSPGLPVRIEHPQHPTAVLGEKHRLEPMFIIARPAKGQTQHRFRGGD